MPEPLKQSDVVPVPKCSPPKSVEELDQDLRPIRLRRTLRRLWAALHSLPFWIKSAINLMFTDLHLRENRPPTLLFIFSTPSFSPLTKAIRTRRVFFADFSKGFYLVDHNMLVRELQLLKIGVHEAIIRWIRSFLTGRVQRVRPWRDPTRNEISSISFCDPSY